MPATPPHKNRSPNDRPPGLGSAMVPVVSLIGMIYLSVVRFETSAHMALVLATAVAACVALVRGDHWESIEEGILEGIQVGMKAVLILMVIGMLIATWIVSGIVPVMIYHGLNLLSPGLFLAAACLICCVVSLATGSSWTTAGTVGVALIGVGQGLGMPLPMVAGAVVSGAYVGDKLSPLSDTTNLAPAVAGSELFEHVRYMLYTTVPALILALGVYLFLGSRAGGEVTDETVTGIQRAIADHYNLNLLLLLPPLLVVGMVVFKLPALPALLGGVVVGAGCGMVFQGNSLRTIVTAAYDGFVSETGHAAVDDLLSRGGMSSMMDTVALILCALSFGGVMERTGQLAALAGAILKLARSTGSLVASTVATCLGMNVLAPDQYLSIVVPGRMFREAYRKAGLQPKVLSRTLEDAGTLTSPLIAWNTCGAFMTGTLGVKATAYAPYAFVNLLTPAIAILLAFTGWTIARTAVPNSPEDRPAAPSQA